MNPSAAWRLARPGNCLMTAVAVAAGAVVATGAGALAHAAAVATAMAAAVAFAAAGNALNDLTDAELDRRAHPERPIPRGEATPRGAALLSALLFVASVALGAAVGLLGAAIVLAALPLMLAYEWRLKALGLPGNVAIGILTGAPFILGGAAAGSVPPVLWVFALLAALATVGRELLKDIEDMDADVDRRTLPRSRGPRVAAAVAAVALVGSVLLSPLPLLVAGGLDVAYVPLVVAADAGFLWSARQGTRAPGRAQRVAKASMAVALAAFVAGRIVPEVRL